MKERPKVGDRVEIKGVTVKVGTVLAVAETGVHFLIRMSDGRQILRRLGITSIIRILPEEVVE